MQGPAGTPGPGGQRGPNVSMLDTHHVPVICKAMLCLIRYHQFTSCGRKAHYQVSTGFIFPVLCTYANQTAVCALIGSSGGKRTKGTNWKAWRKGELGGRN